MSYGIQVNNLTGTTILGEGYPNHSRYARHTLMAGRSYTTFPDAVLFFRPTRIDPTVTWIVDRVYAAPEVTTFRIIGTRTRSALGEGVQIPLDLLIFRLPQNFAAFREAQGRGLHIYNELGELLFSSKVPSAAIIATGLALVSADFGNRVPSTILTPASTTKLRYVSMGTLQVGALSGRFRLFFYDGVKFRSNNNFYFDGIVTRPVSRRFPPVDTASWAPSRHLILEI